MYEMNSGKTAGSSLMPASNFKFSINEGTGKATNFMNTTVENLKVQEL